MAKKGSQEWRNNIAKSTTTKIASERAKRGWKTRKRNGWRMSADQKAKLSATSTAWLTGRPKSPEHVLKIRAGASRLGGLAKRIHPVDPKLVARYLINHAVETGIVVKPKKCARCWRKIRVEAHHPDYTKPLEVIWLCKLCHEGEHHRYG